MITIQEGNKRKHKPRNLNAMMWAYFAPDGHIQVRSIAETKKLSRETIVVNVLNFPPITYKDYEAAGYMLKRIKIIIKV